MPAFDPVRDAVLNSPLSATNPLPLPSAIPSPHPASEIVPSPTLVRRATDLAVLLNNDPPSNDYEQRGMTSSSTPAGRLRSSTLSRILQPIDTEPLDILQPSLSRNIESPSTPGSLFSPNSPAQKKKILDPSTSTHAVYNPLKNPKRSSVPYAPTNRRTPAASVLIPLTPAELDLYLNPRNNPLRTNILKRKHDEPGSDPFNANGKGKAKAEGPTLKRSRDVALVEEHYNLRPDVGVNERQLSPIIGLKNFNNWVKSVLIAKFAHPALKQKGRPNQMGGKVLDMGCGKGGDLNKWQKAKVSDYFGVDIASVSIEQARQRSGGREGANHRSRFSAQFRVLDCYTRPLTDVLTPFEVPPQAPPFDVVSMQFCMHYAFETQQKARTMLENVTRWLRPGGVFVGTIPNDEFLLSRLAEIPADQEELSFGNAVYRIRFEERTKRPLYGHRYYFYLKDAVGDVPEYVVQWDNFVSLASEYGLALEYKKEFHEVYTEENEDKEFGPLLQKMKVVDREGESQMDEDQWDAANIYVAFAFKKR